MSKVAIAIRVIDVGWCGDCPLAHTNTLNGDIVCRGCEGSPRVGHVNRTTSLNIDCPLEGAPIVVRKVGA